MPPSESQPLLSRENGQQNHGPSFNIIKSSRHLLLGSWMNVLLVAVPICLIAEPLHWPAVVRFITSFLAIIPLAKLLGDATEQVSMRLGQTLGGLLNASFGNAVELIVAIAALAKDELRLVQTSLLGSVLSNLLLVLGMSFFASGFFYYESTFQMTAAQASSSLMTLACITLILPAAYHASLNDGTMPFASDDGDDKKSLHGLLVLSRGTSIILLCTYIGYLFFQLKTHARLFEAEQGEEEEEEAEMDQYSAGIWLLIVTVVTAFSADVLVGSIDETAQQYHIPKQFIGLILLPLVGNAAEHVTSVWMACKGKMELTIGVSVGSSIQIAAGMIPLLVIIAWPLNKDLTLFFTNYETIVLFVSVMLANLLLQDGRTNYMEGVMLMALYLVIALSYIVHGLLGRAVVETLQAKGDEVLALAWTRADKDSSYTKLDLMDSPSVDRFFADNAVDVVVHCAAERRPDVAEADPAKAAKINADVPAHLGKLAREHDFVLFYISTDYVFNGRQPPYNVNDQPDPLQAYGKQKRDGEIAILKERDQGAKATVLRVPVLYGKTEYNAESAVNILVDIVKDQSKEYKMDHYQVRFPTNVSDIARVLYDLSHLGKPLPAILHYSSPAPAMTKYDMTRIIGKHLNLPIDHVKPDAEKPVIKPGQTERPENTQLSTDSLKEIGVDTREDMAFDDWFGQYIK